MLEMDKEHRNEKANDKTPVCPLIAHLEAHPPCDEVTPPSGRTGITPPPPKLVSKLQTMQLSISEHR